jgi:lipopolysaccharide export system protein LptA
VRSARALTRGVVSVATTAAMLMALFAAAGAAQTASGPPNALQGFSKNRNEPIKIESDSLEVRDKDKVAMFIDNVRVIQGDTTLQCKKLIVHYDSESSQTGAGPRPATMNPAGGNQSIRRLEAQGGVVVTQKDQTAVGDRGIYDTLSNSMTLVGNVVVTQGQNVIRGERLWVDLTTGVSRVECGNAAACRVQGVFQSSGAALPGPGQTTGAATAPTGAAAPRPRPAPNRQPANGSDRNRNRASPLPPPPRAN